jgi:hypothetical protein
LYYFKRYLDKLLPEYHTDESILDDPFSVAMCNRRLALERTVQAAEQGNPLSITDERESTKTQD